MSRSLIIILAAGISTTPAWGALSANLLGGGTFQGTGFTPGANGVGENLSALKTDDSPRTQAEINDGTSPVRAWQFHQGGVAAETAGGVTTGQSFTDLGRWIGASQSPPGFSTFDNPRAVGVVPALQNRTVVTRNGQPNGVMDSVAFRWGMGQFVAAPANVAATGTAQLDYDYFFRYWEGNPTAGSYDMGKLNSTPQILQVAVWGLTADQLPAYAARFEPRHDDFMTPPYPDLFDLGFELLYTGPNFNSQFYDDWLTGSSDPGQSIYGGFTPGMPTDTPDDQVWKRLSDGVDNYAGSAANPVITPNAYDGSFPITKKYDYFYVSARMVVYAEDHVYFWLYGGKPTDTMSVALDNVSLKVPLENIRAAFTAGDMNLDGLVNVQDINPFITALGSEAAYKTYLAGRLTALGIDTGEVNAVYGEVDPNQSGVINVQDINTFVSKLAGNGVDTASLAIIPEPAGLTLLALGGLALLRRQR